MSIQLSYVMRPGDWLKLIVIVLVGYVAISRLYIEYQDTIHEYERIQQMANNM